MEYNKKLGNYKFTKTIRESDHSIIYLCFDELKNKYYSVKSIPKSLFGDPSIVSKIEKRISKLTSLESLQLATFYRTKKTADNLYIFREYCPHNNLEDFLSNKSFKRVSEKEAIKIMKPLLEAINLLHNINMIHGNIKPQNILINNDMFKLSDFAVPEIANITTLQSGTINYRAPEMLFSKEYDDKVDIWSIGVVIYEMIMGKKLFNGSAEEVKIIIKNHETIDFSQLSQIGVKMTIECQKLLNQMICVDPNKRINWDDLWAHQVWKESNIAIVEERLQMIHAADLSRSGMLRMYQKNNRVILNLKFKNQIYGNESAFKTELMTSNVSKFQEDREIETYKMKELGDNKASVKGSETGYKKEDYLGSQKPKKINSKINEEGDSDHSNSEKNKKNTKKDDNGYNDEVIRSKNKKFAPKKKIEQSNVSEISNDSVIKNAMKEGERKKIEVTFQKDSNYYPNESGVKNSVISNAEKMSSEFSFKDKSVVKSMITPEQDYNEQSRINASKCQESQIKQSVKNSDYPLEYSQDTKKKEEFKESKVQDSNRVIHSYLENSKMSIEESNKRPSYEKKEHEKRTGNKNIYESGLDKCSLIKNTNIVESSEPGIHVTEIGDLIESKKSKEKSGKKSTDSEIDEDDKKYKKFKESSIIKTPEESYTPKKVKKGKEPKSDSDSDFGSKSYDSEKDNKKEKDKRKAPKSSDSDSNKETKKKVKKVEDSNFDESSFSKKSKIKKQKNNSDSDSLSDNSEKDAKKKKKQDKKLEQSNVEESQMSKKSKVNEVENSNIEESCAPKKSKEKTAKNNNDSDLKSSDDSDKDVKTKIEKTQESKMGESHMSKKSKLKDSGNYSDSYSDSETRLRDKSKKSKVKAKKSNTDSDFKSDGSENDKKKVNKVDYSNLEASNASEKLQKAKVRPHSDSEDYISDGSKKDVKKTDKEVEKSNISKSNVSKVEKKAEKKNSEEVDESKVEESKNPKNKLSSSDNISDDDLPKADHKKKRKSSSEGDEKGKNKNSDSEEEEAEKTLAKKKFSKKKNKSDSSESEDDRKKKTKANKKKKSSSLGSSSDSDRKVSISQEVIESETELITEAEKKRNEERAKEALEVSQIKQRKDELNFKELKIRYIYVRNILNYIGKIVFDAQVSALYLTFLYSYVICLKKLSKFYEEIIPTFENTNYFNSPIFSSFKKYVHFSEAINRLKEDRVAIDAQITCYLSDLKEQKKTSLYQDVFEFLSADNINMDLFNKILRHFIKNRESHIQSMKKYLNMTMHSVKVHFALFLDCMKWQEIDELKLDDEQECGFQLEVYYTHVKALTEEELLTKIEKDSTYLLNKGEFLNLGFNHLKFKE